MFTRELCLMSRKKITVIHQEIQECQEEEREKRYIKRICEFNGLHRSYASWLSRHAGKKVYRDIRSGRRMVLVADPRIKISRKRARVYSRFVK